MMNSKVVDGGTLASVPMYEVALTRQYGIPYKRGETVAEAAQILHKILDGSPVEKLVSLYMDYDLQIVGAEVIAIGDYSQVACTFQNILRGAIVAGAPHVILGHNHATGLVKPSDPDLEMTGMALTLGSMLGVNVYDHIIVGPNGTHYSLFEHKNELITRSLQIRVMNLLNKFKSADKLATQIF